MTVALFAVLVAAIILVRYNWKAGRGDVRGATQVAVFTFIVALVSNVLLAHHVGSTAEILVVIRMIQLPTLASMLIWIGYLALEPSVRRYWPQSLIVWSRALSGRWRDPVLGRDVLIGMAAGVVLAIGANLFRLLALRAGSNAPIARVLMNLRLEVAFIFSAMGFALFLALSGFLILFFARVLLRNQWLASVVPASFFVAAISVGTPRPALAFAVNFVIYGAVTVVLMRLGLLTAVAALLTVTLLNSPTTSNFTAWYGQGQFLVLLVLVALAVWAFRTSLGGQKLWDSP